MIWLYISSADCVIIHRSVKKRLIESLYGCRMLWPVTIQSPGLSGDSAVHICKKERVSPNGFTVFPDATAFRAEALNQVGIFVGKIDTAGISDIAIDDHRLAVIAEIKGKNGRYADAQD
jgi:protein involved in temperature-dependent protein secretion